MMARRYSRPFCVLSLFTVASSLSVLEIVGRKWTISSRLTRVMSSSSARRVQVWDNVLPDDGLREDLHEYASSMGTDHQCFTFPLSSSSNVRVHRWNVIEETLDAILRESSDIGGCTVEYWTRQDWRHIEAHADVDENLSKQIDKVSSFDDDNNNNDNEMQYKYPSTYKTSHGHRYPIYGHVLYLQVGSNVRGPTCVFPERSSGGDLLRSIHHHVKSVKDNDDDEDNVVDAKNFQLTIVESVIVPAVAGRLLRFNGRDLHTVPRPTDVWMLPFVKGSPEYEPEEVWGRSVILFNIWPHPHNEEPPLDVPLDKNEFWGWELEDETTDLQEIQTLGAFCNPFDDWDDVPICSNSSSSISSTSVESESNQLKVWLLGNERRRDHPLRTVSLLAPVNGGRDVVRKALSEESRVTKLRLRQQ